MSVLPLCYLSVFQTELLHRLSFGGLAPWHAQERVVRDYGIAQDLNSCYSISF